MKEILADSNLQNLELYLMKILFFYYGNKMQNVKNKLRFIIKIKYSRYIL